MAFIFPPVKFKISFALLQDLISHLQLNAWNGREVQRGKLAWSKEVCSSVARLIEVAEAA